MQFSPLCLPCFGKETWNLKLLKNKTQKPQHNTSATMLTRDGNPVSTPPPQGKPGVNLRRRRNFFLPPNVQEIQHILEPIPALCIPPNANTWTHTWVQIFATSPSLCLVLLATPWLLRRMWVGPYAPPFPDSNLCLCRSEKEDVSSEFPRPLQKFQNMSLFKKAQYLGVRGQTKGSAK